MKRFLFLTLLSCVCLWTHTVAGREHKNERDEEEERSISPNPVEVKIVNDGIMFYFMNTAVIVGTLYMNNLRMRY